MRAMVGGPSLRFFQGRALGVLHAARINPPLRARRSAFRKPLLLSPLPISEAAAGAKPICRDSRAGPRSPGVLAARIRGNAGSRASTDRRTEERHAFHGGTGLKQRSSHLLRDKPQRKNGAPPTAERWTP